MVARFEPPQDPAASPAERREGPASLQKGGFAACLNEIAETHPEAERLEIWSQDEARVGQKGRTGYVWWQRGHTPRGRRDVGYQSAWIIGAVCPARDTGVALVLTRLDTEAMNLFLAELSQAVAPGAHGVVLMDKAGWHIAGDLVVPSNLSLVFLPPYSPELNPIERLWLHLRDNRFSHCVFQTTGEIVDSCCDAWNWMLGQTGRIRSLCSYPWLARVGGAQSREKSSIPRPHRDLDLLSAGPAGRRGYLSARPLHSAGRSRRRAQDGDLQRTAFSDW